jgi:hypothetical protein
LKITNGAVVGKIWFSDGELIDSETQTLRAEEAFKKILSWKTGSFEILPPEQNRTRTIFGSYQGLLLESAQALDEAHAGGEEAIDPDAEAAEPSGESESPLTPLARFSGVDFVLSIPADREKYECWGLENPENLAGWVRQSVQQLRSLGEALGAGQLQNLECGGPHNCLGIVSQGDSDLCVGFHASLSQDLMRETMPKILEKWAS